jgi:hypothetical protein
MKVIVGDLETFWSQTHSLSKMSPIDYCLHKETELISLSLKVGDAPTKVVFGEWKIRELLERTDFSDALFVAHNMSGFDAMIFAWRLGVKPKAWGCTLAMAKPIHNLTVGNSLAKLVEHYELGKKDNTVLLKTQGRKLAEFTAAEREQMKIYNEADTEQCAALFKKLLPHYNSREMWQIDSTIRMLIDPKLILDKRMLESALIKEQARKVRALQKLASVLDLEMLDLKRQFGEEEAIHRAVVSGVMDAAIERTKATLMSNVKLAAVMAQEGVTPPTKISPTTGQQTLAFSKTDQEFLALQEHENELVAAAVCARLDVKSTIIETRLESFINVGKTMKGKLPVPLNYCGATTTGRWGAGIGGLNLQNLPRVNPKAPKISDALRCSINAPPGHKLVVADLSGIELRVNHFLWKVPSSMDLFKKDPAEADLYRQFAASLYAVPVKDVSKDQRQMGKVAQLGLGFGSGAETFRSVAKTMGGVTLTEAESENIKNAWREMYPEIVQGWKKCHSLLPAIESGDIVPIDPWGLTRTCAEGIMLPSGRYIRYPELRKQMDEAGKTEWFYGEGRHTARIYAGKIDENCIAEGTLVLCERGWVPIQDVRLDDRVHDGVEFVRHAGKVFKSVQTCVTVDGVFMTPDHEVLTDEGWKAALEVQRPYRPNIREVDSGATDTVHGKDMELGVPVRMWKSLRETWLRRQKRYARGESAQLRVFQLGQIETEGNDTRHVKAPGIRSVEGYVGPLPAAIAQGVEKLRSAWNNSVCSMASIFREFLGGHGQLVPAGDGLGSKKQRRRLHKEELPVGFSSGKHHEQTKYNSHGGRAAVERTDWNKPLDAVLSNFTRMEQNTAADNAECQRSVYDIVNCGPRQRFVVKGKEGPFIVHNCVQALARDVVADMAFDIYKATKQRPVLSVHDELMYVAPEEDADALLDTVLRIMRTPPAWWPQLVVWAAGSTGTCYGEMK